MSPPLTSVSGEGEGGATFLEAPGNRFGNIPWGPLAGVFWGLAIFLGSQLAAALAVVAVYKQLGHSSAAAQSWLSDTVLGQFLFILVAEALTVGGILWYVRHRQGTARQLGFTGLQARYLGMALLGFGMYFVSFILVTSLTSVLVPSLNIDQKQDVGFEDASSSLQLMLTFCSLVVFAPIAEEVVFRGFMFAGLRRRWPFVPAALVTSALFASGHLFGAVQGEPLLWIAALDTFVLSIVLCKLRDASDSLWPSILVHGIKNFIAFFFLFLAK